MLIDDLVTVGTDEPYRMMTSRSEFRLLLRQDNADERLTPIGYKVGLISEERYQCLLKKESEIEAEVRRLEQTHVGPSQTLNDYLEFCGTEGITNGMTLAKLLKRPQVSYEGLGCIDSARPPLDSQVTEQVELRIKYEGYIKLQLEQVEAMRKLESKLIPDDIDYSAIKGLRLEAAEKLSKIRPANIGQASRISGVNPADVSVLLIWLDLKRREES